jgi:hypothetical protein
MKNENKFKSMAVAMLMLVSVIAVSTVVTSTTVTNNDVAESTPAPGATYALVLDFTLKENGTDSLLAGTLPGAGTILASAGEAVDWGASTTVTGNLSYYDAANGGVWNAAADCIFNDTNENGLYNTGETVLAGTAPADGTAITGVGVLDGDWNGIVTFDASTGDAWDPTVDAIFYEADANRCYQDSLNDVDIANTGTMSIANTENVTSFALWAESGDTSGFQSDEDIFLTENDSDATTFTNVYDCGTDGYNITSTTTGHRFYITANMSGLAYPGTTLKIKLDFDANTLNSTDGTAYLTDFTNANAQTAGKLGIDYFEGNQSGPANIIKTNPDSIYYGNTVSIKVDTSLLESTGNYYLYRPYYKRSGSIPGAYTYELQWVSITAGGGSVYIVSDQSSTKTFSDISLDYAGMWLIENDADPSDCNGTDTDYAYFWVNNTSPYTIDVSNDDIYYANNESITITVTEEGSTAPTWIDVRSDDDTLVIHSWEPDGTLSLTGTTANFSSAGNFTVDAYYDNDVTMIGYDSYGYSAAYGYTEPSALVDTATNYSIYCGPWDPYEKNASSQTIRVRTGEPTVTVQSGNDTMYWGFDGEVNITIKGYDGENLSGSDANLNVFAFNEDDVNVSANLTIDSSNIANGYIHVSSTTWGKDGTYSYGENGTWYVYIFKNIDADSGANEYSQEWNTTAEWEVARAPKGQFKWIDDDGTVFDDDDNDGVIPNVPSIWQLPLTIKFDIYDEEGNAFGDLASGESSSILECAENITISGDSLFTGSVDTFPAYTSGFFNDPHWEIPIIPTMSVGGGEITITVTAFNSTLTETLSIGGTDYEEHGSVVEVSPNSFQIDQEDQSLSITIKNAETGSSNPYCTAYLYYLDDNGEPINQTGSSPNTKYVAYATASGGEYTLVFNMTQQTENQTYVDFDGDSSVSDTEIMAPRNLTIFVDGPGNRDGYALIKMTSVNDLEVELSHITILAGKQYDDFYINCTLIGNTTDTPDEGDKDKFHIKIIDEDDDDVTDTLLNGIDANDLTDDGDYIFRFNNVYATEPGTYTIYAYNNTHDSTDYNATLVVEQVTVTCDKTPLIWKYDENISATFTVTYNGNAINGSLVLDNISLTTHEDGDYNKTWMNSSFDGSTDQALNSSIEIESDELINGVITLHDITANYLADEKAQQNITFWFKPDSDDGAGAYARASGMLPVSVPTVTPTQQYVAVGQTTSVDITVTGRGTLLDDIYVGLHGRGIEQNGTSGTDGIVTFSVLPTSSGNISIDVGEEGRTVETVLIATNWKLDVSVSPTDVNEGEEFTVMVTEERSGDKVEGATVKIQGVSTMTTDSNGEATFTAPEVTSDRTYTVSTSKAGYAPETDQITVRVINVPRLVISADEKVGPGESFEVAVAKDSGDPVIGATVEFNGKTYTTKAGGVATLTAPTEKGDYTITASFGIFEDATTTIKVTDTGGIPGFELLTLVAALGVAFILLRRRRQ